MLDDNTIVMGVSVIVIASLQKSTSLSGEGDQLVAQLHNIAVLEYFPGLSGC